MLWGQVTQKDNLQICYGLNCLRESKHGGHFEHQLLQCFIFIARRHSQDAERDIVLPFLSVRLSVTPWCCI